MSKTWILVGSLENWETATVNNIWGVREPLRKDWDKLQKGDLLFFYSKSPVSGIIGIGRIESKFKQDKPLWPDEIRVKEVIYPYRFNFQIEYYLPVEKWEGDNIDVADLHIAVQKGLNSLPDSKKAQEIIKRANEKWQKDLDISIEEKIVERKAEKKPSLHNEIRDMLNEIGRLRGFISEKEYSIDGEKLDVAWRRVVRGVPTKVFEVQIGGSIHQALSKLKHSFDLWNSELFLVLQEQDKHKVNELLSGTFHEIADQIKVITTDKIEELYNFLRQGEKLKELGL